MITSLVSLLLAASIAVGETAGSPAESLAPYQQTWEDGSYVDWMNGTVGALGRVRIFRDIDRNDAMRRLTRREAEHLARDLVLAAVGRISVDGSIEVGSRPDVMDAARSAIDETEPKSAGRSRGVFFDAILEFPLRGESGVIARLLPDPVRPAGEAGVTRASSKADVGEGDDRGAGLQVTGVVIDARHLVGESRPGAALLPRIVDEDGRIVYDVASVDPDFARDRGLAAYAIVVPDSQRDRGEVARPRHGPNPLRIRATGSSGPGLSDIVIASADADDLLRAAGAARFLEECRVVVLMAPPPPVGPGKQPAPRRPTQPTAPTEDRGGPE